MGPQELIDAACGALVDGLDAPALRELAGASPRDPSWQIRELTAATLDELSIPAPGSLPPGRSVAACGGTTRRAATDTLHLTVTPAPAEAGGGFQVEIRVNGVETTSAGAGLGMDPHDLLVPANRLLATTVPHTVGIARCECGVYGCGSADITKERAPYAGEPMGSTAMLGTAPNGVVLRGTPSVPQGLTCGLPRSVPARWSVCCHVLGGSMPSWRCGRGVSIPRVYRRSHERS